jgi:hypothetical protein
MIRRSNSGLDHPQLRAKGGNARTCDVGQPFVTCVGDHIEQLFNTIASDRCDDAKLGQMRADRIDHCGLLANEQMARAVEHQAALLSSVLVATNRMFALVTASQMASRLQHHSSAA